MVHLGVHKTTLRFNDSQERLTELSRTVILSVAIYYSKQMGIKISRGKRHEGQDLGKTRHELSVVFSQ